MDAGGRKERKAGSSSPVGMSKAALVGLLEVLAYVLIFLWIFFVFFFFWPLEGPPERFLSCRDGSAVPIEPPASLVRIQWAKPFLSCRFGCSDRVARFLVRVQWVRSGWELDWIGE